LIASYVVLCPLGVPATPMLIAGGMVFGTFWGSVYNLIGIVLGGVATYYLGRGLGRDFVLHLAGKRMKRVERAIGRHAGFWSLVGLRFLPLPFALVNYCAALAGIRPLPFTVSTAVGMVLTIPIFTYFAATLSRAASGDRSGVFLQIAMAMVLLALLTVLPRFWSAWKRRSRYREIIARRRARKGALGG
jgi:uncharacterized membrane protein YdjX (TVP38/TMEM64 family)